MNRTVTTEASARFGEELADALRKYQEEQNISDPELAAAYADGFEYVPFTDVIVRRVPELDGSYRGHTYMEWCDDQDRTDLVKLANFQCHPDDDCEGTSCPAHEYCDRFKEESEYET